MTINAEATLDKPSQAPITNDNASEIVRPAQDIPPVSVRDHFRHETARELFRAKHGFNEDDLRPPETQPEAHVEKHVETETAHALTEPEAMTPQQYLKWRQTGEVPTEKTQTEAPARLEDASQEDLLAASLTYGEQTHQQAQKLFELYGHNHAEAEGLRRTLALAQRGDDFPQVVAKLTHSFFADAGTPEGRARTEVLHKALDRVDNAAEVHLALLRHPSAQNELQKATPEQIAQVVTDASVGLKVGEARQAYDDFDAVAAPAMRAIAAANSPIVMEAFGGSRNMAHIAYVIGKDPAEAQAFAQLARTNPLAAVRKLAVYDHLIQQELDKGRSGKGTKTEVNTVETPAPPPLRVPSKLVTSAPKPAQVVSSNGAAPSDEVEQAVASGDFRAFQAAANARDLARAGFRR